MFNLLVKSSPDAWDGSSASFEVSRCVREHTAEDISARFSTFDEPSVAALTQMPAIFAYEKGVDAFPKFGRITQIRKLDNRGEMRIDYEIYPLDRFITNDELWSMSTELDLGKTEHWRTHWAVKNVDLLAEMASKGVALPAQFTVHGAPVDVLSHRFEVAFSFPGEYRSVVAEVVKETMKLLPPNACFYDDNYTAQLARPSLDVLLQDIYSHRSRLLVVFVGADYQRKMWPNIEWHAVRSVIHTARNSGRVMFFRMDAGHVDGVFVQDGYIDVPKFTPVQMAKFVAERVRLAPPLPPT